MTVERYLYVFVFILYRVYERHSYLWFYVYIYSIIVFRNTPLFLSFLWWTSPLSVCFIYLYLTIVHAAYWFMYVLKIGD